MTSQSPANIIATLAATAAIANAAFASEPAICKSAAPVIQKGLGSKLKAGVPFEIFSVAIQGEKTTCTKAFKLHLSLWDNRVRIMDADTVLGRFSNADYATFVCSQALCEQKLAPGKKTQLRIFANPNWAESMARLESRTSSFVLRFFSIDWSDLKKNMQKDEFLFEGEFTP